MRDKTDKVGCRSMNEMDVTKKITILNDEGYIPSFGKNVWETRLFSVYNYNEKRADLMVNSYLKRYPVDTRRF